MLERSATASSGQSLLNLKKNETSQLLETHCTGNEVGHVDRVRLMFSFFICCKTTSRRETKTIFWPDFLPYMYVSRHILYGVQFLDTLERYVSIRKLLLDNRPVHSQNCMMIMRTKDTIL